MELNALFHALNQKPELDSGGQVAFLNARPHEELARFRDRLRLEQNHRSWAEALESGGWTIESEIVGAFPLVLIVPGQQKQRVLADLARGMALLADGGILLVAMRNDTGASRFERHLAELAGDVQSLSKHKCRAFWSQRTDKFREDLAAEWRDSADWRLVNGDFWSRPGLFSWDRIDPGSRLLTEHLPESISGAVADFGCGWGYLSRFVMRHRPNVTSLDLFENDRCALEASRRNLEGLGREFHLHWHDLAHGVESGCFSYVVMNPPFHQGKETDSTLGQTFIRVAARALRKGGQLCLVANKHLPYEATMQSAFSGFRVAAERDGFKVLIGTRA